MTKKERYQFVINYFSLNSPDAKTELMYDNPYQLLVAVILSAQCTDKRVNMTTPAIFEKYPDLESLSRATSEELFPLIKSISYPNNKTNHLIGMAKMVMRILMGKIPMTVEELIKLPGVGRKTANVITSVVDNQPNMAVDTHVFRVSARIGLTVKCENTLGNGKTIGKKFANRSHLYRAPLANIAWPLYLHCQNSKMWHLWIKTRLQIL